MGITAPSGTSVQSHWDFLLNGHTALAPLSYFDAAGISAQLAGHISGDLGDGLPPRLLVQTDRVTRMALHCAHQALTDSGLLHDPVRLATTGVVTALSAGGFQFGENELQSLCRRGPQAVTAYQSYAWFYAVNTGQVSIAHGCKGPSTVTANEHDGGLVALQMAVRSIASGSPRLLVGGFDATLSSWGVAARDHDPWLCHGEERYRPWGTAATGYSVGEGGAFLVMETAEEAIGRGADVLAVVTSARQTRRRRDEEWSQVICRTVALLLRDAQVAAEDVGVVLADGLGIPDIDRAEAQALAQVVPHALVTIPKRGCGRLLAGAGVVDTVSAILCLLHEQVPPTPGTPYDTHLGTLVWNRVPHTSKHCLVLATDHRGTCSATLLSRPERNFT